MKKLLTYLFLFSIVTFLVCGCSKEDEQQQITPEEPDTPATVVGEFSAVTESYTRTSSKTSLGSSYEVLWGEGDAIFVSAGGDFKSGLYSVATGGVSTSVLELVTESSAVMTGANVGYYPHSSAITCAEGDGVYTILGVEIPSVQNYRGDGFSAGVSPAVAVTGSTAASTLNFKNILGLVKITLKDESESPITVKSIVFKGNNGEILSGSATVTASATVDPELVFTSGGGTSITLDCGEGVALTADGVEFYVALPAIEFEGGYTLTVTDGDGQESTLSDDTAFEVVRSGVVAITPEREEEPEEPEDLTACIKFTSEGTSTLALSKSGSPTVTPYLEYSLDGTSWKKWDYSSITYSTLYLRGKGNTAFASNSTAYYYFVMGGENASCSGNIMALLDYEKPDEATMGDYCFTYLFYNCTSLTTAPVLPATTLAPYCYYAMFQYCESLVYAPELPATTLADFCYSGMFWNCTSLTTAPVLPATTLAPYCYYAMFQYCESLASASALPAETLADYCYYCMFYSTALTTAPELPATTLASNCYTSMFYGCTSLTTAPELPATTLASRCYVSMFNGCTSLTTAPELLATTLASYCYAQMFWDCTSLITAPELPATTLAPYCYYQMFRGCASLTSAPELPATILADYCYYAMFYGCSSLTSAPELPATTLASRCYPYMFYECTSLTTVPELPATTLARECYWYMFYGCTSLNCIKCLATDISASDCTTDWVQNVASEGTFICAKGMKDKWKATSNTDYNHAPYGWTITDGSEGGEESGNYIVFTSEGTSTLALSKNNSPSVTPYLEYSLDGTSWQEWDYSVITYSTLYLRGKGNTAFASVTYRYYYFAMGGDNNASVSGNIMALLDYENPDTVTMGRYCFLYLFKNCAKLTDISNLSIPATTLASYCYAYMFYGCTSLTTAPELPATTLASYCYDQMFYGCTSLTAVPALPATTLESGCYAYMFQNCTALTTAPELPATTLAVGCYGYMFYGCTSLTTAPELPATTLASNCYAYMFDGCTSLTTAPELPATTLAEFCCAFMFQNCTSLTTASELPATTLATYCYQSMFQNCTSLTTAPELPATTLANDCYEYMFDGCTSLTSAPEKLPATTLAEFCYYRMFSGCTSLTSAPELPATTLASRCYTYMFYECTSLTTAPELPATTLASNCYAYMFGGCTSLATAPEIPATTLVDYCYQNMFNGCTSLATAPELPATTLATYCYYQMFYGCKSLNYIKCLATDINDSNCTSNWVKNVASEGTFVCAEGMTDTWKATSSTDYSHAPYNWTITPVGSK